MCDMDVCHGAQVFINQKNEIAAARETQQLAEKEMEALKKESERLATLSAEARSVLGKEQVRTRCIS